MSNETQKTNKKIEWTPKDLIGAIILTILVAASYASYDFLHASMHWKPIQAIVFGAIFGLLITSKIVNAFAKDR